MAQSNDFGNSSEMGKKVEGGEFAHFSDRPNLGEISKSLPNQLGPNGFDPLTENTPDDLFDSTKKNYNSNACIIDTHLYIEVENGD